MTDYATAAEIKARINKTQTDDDATIAALATAASRAVDSFCNRPDGFVALSVATARIYPGSGKSWLAIDDCTAITAVAAKTSATDTAYTAWAATDYLAFCGDPERPNYNLLPYTAIRTAAGGSYGSFLNGGGDPMIQVTAKWGYAASCPPAIKEATITLASRWYKRGESAWSDVLASGELGQLLFKQALDPDVKFMLRMGRFVRPVV